MNIIANIIQMANIIANIIQMANIIVNIIQMGISWHFGEVNSSLFVARISFRQIPLKFSLVPFPSKWRENSPKFNFKGQALKILIFIIKGS